jgi:hypothetical protein
MNQPQLAAKARALASRILDLATAIEVLPEQPPEVLANQLAVTAGSIPAAEHLLPEAAENAKAGIRAEVRTSGA